jgi:hypothetical protein
MSGGRSITKWCRDLGISRGSFYGNRKRDPRSVPYTTSVGRREIITDEAHEEWREYGKQKALEKRQAPSDPPCST